MLQSATVYNPGMTGNRTGADTRRKILLALLESEPRTVHGLALAIEEDQANVGRHIGRMEKAELVTVERRRGRLGSKVWLTEAGRMAARTI